jgi:hypothetical protein
MDANATHGEHERQIDADDRPVTDFEDLDEEIVDDPMQDDDMLPFEAAAVDVLEQRAEVRGDDDDRRT